MIILEEKIWEDYQKEIQKISARALGIAMTQDSHEMQKGETSCRGGSKHGKKSGILCNDWIGKSSKGSFRQTSNSGI